MHLSFWNRRVNSCRDVDRCARPPEVLLNIYNKTFSFLIMIYLLIQLIVKPLSAYSELATAIINPTWHMLISRHKSRSNFSTNDVPSYIRR